MDPAGVDPHYNQAAVIDIAEADAGVFISHEVMLKWASNLTDETRSCESDNTSG